MVCDLGVAAHGPPGASIPPRKAGLRGWCSCGGCEDALGIPALPITGKSALLSQAQNHGRGVG